MADMDYTGLRQDRAAALDSVIDEAEATRGGVPLWSAVSTLLVERRARGIIDGDDHRAIEAWIDGIGSRPVTAPSRIAALGADLKRRHEQAVAARDASDWADRISPRPGRWAPAPGGARPARWVPRPSGAMERVVDGDAARRS